MGKSLVSCFLTHGVDLEVLPMLALYEHGTLFFAAVVYFMV